MFFAHWHAVLSYDNLNFFMFGLHHPIFLQRLEINQLLITLKVCLIVCLGQTSCTLSNWTIWCCGYSLSVDQYNIQFFFFVFLLEVYYHVVNFVFALQWSLFLWLVVNIYEKRYTLVGFRQPMMTWYVIVELWFYLICVSRPCPHWICVIYQRIAKS